MTPRKGKGDAAQKKSSSQSRGRIVPREAGFRRFKKYKTAVDPFDLRALLDPQPGDDHDAVYERMGERARRRFEALVEDLDAIAPKIFIKQAGSRPCCEVTQFILGIDIEDDRHRARAIVARAYWRADEYVHGKAEFLAEAAEYAEIVLDFDRFQIDTKAENAMYAFAQLQMDKLPERREREEEIRHGLAKLDDIVSALRVFVTENSPSGRPLDDGRLFFVLRLAEAFTIWTGRPPDFDTGERVSAPEWLNFIEVALELGGLGKPDNLSRRLCDFAPVEGAHPRQERHKTASGEWEWFPPPPPIIHRTGELKHDIKSIIYHFYESNSRFSRGELPSSGFLTNVWRGDASVHQPLEPAAYEWFLPASQRRRRRGSGSV